MGLELYILGIRKIRKAEVKELTGKSLREMEKSEFHKKFFKGFSAGYRCITEDELSQDNSRQSIRHMFTPVQDENGDTVYVFWKEELAYFWHKDPDDRERIGEILGQFKIDWDQQYHVVPYSGVKWCTHCAPQLRDGRTEIVALLYG